MAECVCRRIPNRVCIHGRVHRHARVMKNGSSLIRGTYLKEKINPFYLKIRSDDGDL